ncbi:MAG TPA: hypothetical protein VKX96_02325 [Chloroflexota bacterium]|nr:hypothetical protein [Chloroflexota bacterium]
MELPTEAFAVLAVPDVQTIEQSDEMMLFGLLTSEPDLAPGQFLHV